MTLLSAARAGCLAALLAACTTKGTLQIADSGTSPTETPTTETDPPSTPTESTPGEETGTPGTASCPPVDAATRTLVLTDIDETLTTSDTEWLTQIALPNSDPAMRPDADRVMQTYFDRGYAIAYVTARGAGLRLLDGTTAREATERWLDDHAFPYTPEMVFLANGIGALGGEAADYKIRVLEDLLDQGYTFEFAYGNADTDIEAFQAVGIPDDRIFLVGKLAGQFGVEPIPTEEAFDLHLPVVEQHVPCAPR